MKGPCQLLITKWATVAQFACQIDERFNVKTLQSADHFQCLTNQKLLRKMMGYRT